MGVELWVCRTVGVELRLRLCGCVTVRVELCVCVCGTVGVCVEQWVWNYEYVELWV